VFSLDVFFSVFPRLLGFPGRPVVDCAGLSFWADEGGVAFCFPKVSQGVWARFVFSLVPREEEENR